MVDCCDSGAVVVLVERERERENMRNGEQRESARAFPKNSLATRKQKERALSFLRVDPNSYRSNKPKSRKKNV